MAGNRERLTPLLRPAPGRGPQQERACPGFPALKRRAIENLAYRSNYLVYNHKRRAIEFGNEQKKFPRTLLSSNLGAPELAAQKQKKFSFLVYGLWFRAGV